ncbi:MAG TPA: hypothetical protein VF167_14330 [Longimicrobiaceae bacterium]
MTRIVTRPRDLAALRSTGEFRWFTPVLERLTSLRGDPDPLVARFLDPSLPVLIGRAPGRLDVMGGIADYSGSLVLELPLAVATFAVLQPHDSPSISVLSLRERGTSFATLDLHELARAATHPGSDQTSVQSATTEDDGDPWIRYVAGVVGACLSRAGKDVSRAAAGVRLLILSWVPEGKGVSSSAALEVAVMGTVAAHLGLELTGQEVARTCQWVENHVVGAPCGIMDQLTSALGERDRLLRIRCQPDQLEDTLEVPADYRFFGIDSGVRHAVTGADYSTVRCAAFMGYRIIAEAAGLPVRLEEERAIVEDGRWGGYLANLTPDELGEFEDLLPHRLRGYDFLARYGGHTDTATRVDPEREYPVRAATLHPVLENERVAAFAQLVPSLSSVDKAALSMGELMYGSHASYGACGLGSEATDRLVELVRDAGPTRGLFGAKITGGGSGGTVAVLARSDAEEAVRDIAARHAAETGQRVELFSESGPGLRIGKFYTLSGSG